MKTIAKMRIHLGLLRDHGLMQVAMVDVEKCLNEIERELEEEYVALPKDADGETIHIGDKLTGKYLTGNPVVECTRLTLTNGWMVGHGRADGTPELFSHHKPPTVEDTLREMLVQAVGYSEANTTVALNAIAEYAERLQLREED